MSVLLLAAVAGCADCVDPFAGMAQPIKERQVVAFEKNVFCINVRDCVFAEIKMSGHELDGALYVHHEKAELLMSSTLFSSCASEQGSGVVFWGSRSEVVSMCCYKMSASGLNGNAAYLFTPESGSTLVNHSSFSMCQAPKSVYGTFCIAYTKLSARLVNASNNQANRASAFYLILGRNLSQIGYFTVAGNSGGTICSVIADRKTEQEDIHDVIFTQNDCTVSLISGKVAGNYSKSMFVANKFPKLATGTASFRFVECQFDCKREDLNNTDIVLEQCTFEGKIVTPIYDHMNTYGCQGYVAPKTKSGIIAFAVILAVLVVITVALGALGMYLKRRHGKPSPTILVMKDNMGDLPLVFEGKPLLDGGTPHKSST